jgi:hypothetical protein
MQAALQGDSSYSFYGINDKILKLGPEDAMQFRKAIKRLLNAAVRTTPKFGPLLQYKVDISDGFYRITLTTAGVKKLGVLLPEFPGMPPLVAFPLVLPMDWTDSPAFFCVFTETICDLANKDIQKNVRYPVHPLEDTAGKLNFADCSKRESQSAPTTQSPSTTEGGSQGTSMRPALTVGHRPGPIVNFTIGPGPGQKTRLRTQR